MHPPEEAYLISRAFPQGLEILQGGPAEVLTTGLLQKSEEWLKRALSLPVGGFRGCLASALNLLRDLESFYFVPDQSRMDMQAHMSYINTTISPMLSFLSLLCPESNVIVFPLSQMMRLKQRYKPQWTI